MISSYAVNFLHDDDVWGNVEKYFFFESTKVTGAREVFNFLGSHIKRNRLILV